MHTKCDCSDELARLRRLIADAARAVQAERLEHPALRALVDEWYRADFEKAESNPCLDCSGPPAGECIYCEHYSRLIKIEVGSKDTAPDFNDEHYVPFQ